MSTIINGTSNAITFPDNSIQNTSAIVSGYVPYANLPAGSVLQVVQATYSTAANTTSSTFSDTGITVSITPKFATSKILAIVDVNGCGKSGGNGNLRLQLLRGASVISNFEGIAGNTSTTATNFFGNCGISYLDSPATISSTTYKVQFACDNAGTASINNATGTGSMSQITLMEIAV
jgi:hypothetical protein